MFDLDMRMRETSESSEEPLLLATRGTHSAVV